jgi:segregation and condensation protein A
MTSKYFLKLDQFEGPMDLLLYLIRVHEINIFDIDILELTTQYLNYLRLVEFEDLNTAGEFVDMAASLIEIKSRSLLPKAESQSEGEGEEMDPEKSLQERLLTYELFRRAGEYFGAKPQLGVQVLTNHECHRLAEKFKDIEAPLTGDPSSLVILYEQMLAESKDRKPSKVQLKTHLVSVEEKMIELKERLETLRFILFQSFYGTFNSRYEFVVYLLASLELVKSKEIKLYQQELFGPLWMYLSTVDPSILPQSRPKEPALESVESSASSLDPSHESMVTGE